MSDHNNNNNNGRENTINPLILFLLLRGGLTDNLIPLLLLFELLENEPGDNDLITWLILLSLLNGEGTINPLLLFLLLNDDPCPIGTRPPVRA